MPTEQIFQDLTNRNYRVSYRQGLFYPQKRFYFFFWQDCEEPQRSLFKAFRWIEGKK